MNTNTLKAKEFLVYYFRLVAKKSGVGWDSDNDMEIEQLIDYIIAAAVEEVEARNEPGESWQAYQELKRQHSQNTAWEDYDRNH